MAKKVTNEDIKLINDLYYQYHTYAEVARQTGWSAGTVKRYVRPDYIPISEIDIIQFDESLIPEFSTAMFTNLDNFGELCVLSEDERTGIRELWEEMSL